ncbi:hypothetical protein QX776_12480 [Alteromonadaceae bacterium BrNp21-10]|nr:hypothetical protein [Alteromonadaceae bacterium BrNp21-10]
MLKRIIFSSFLLMSLTANAALIQWDAFNDGDNLAVKDTDSDLVWLDLSLTAGLSFNQARTAYSGWIVPALDQIKALFESAFPIHNISSGLTYDHACTTSICAEQYGNWINLFGAVDYSRYSLGYYLDAGNNVSLLGASKKYNREPVTLAIYTTFFTFGPQYSGTFDADETSSLWSTFLIKHQEPAQEFADVQLILSPSTTVSEPPVFWLMLAMMMLIHKQSRASQNKTLT